MLFLVSISRLFKLNTLCITNQITTNLSNHEHSNGVNNCKASPGDSGTCDKKNNFFPAFGGTDNVCGALDFSKTAVVS